MILVGMIVSISLALQLAEPPSLLREVLRRDSTLAIFDPPVHLPGDYTVEELRGFGYWPPWVLTDLDGDKQPDVAAAVVRREGAQLLFGVLVVNAREPTRVHWIQQLGQLRAYGVAANRIPDSITPLHCIECDTNTWFRWSGRSYEVELYRPGERIAVATYEQRVKLGLFDRPRRDSRMILGVAPCTEATVVRVAGDDYNRRWYLVELSKPKRLRGWIPASFVAESECIG